MDQRLGHVSRAKLAEVAERFEDMMEAMTQAVRLNSKLDVTERNLLSVACKNVLGNVRTALRQCPVEDTSDDVRKDCITKYRNHLEKEVEDVCSNVIELLDSHLLTKELETEEKVFFLKMEGDYWRYIAESSEKDKKQQAADKSKGAYEAAMKESSSLAATNPVRLGLALNYSVFHYEIANDPKSACQLAKSTFDTAIKGLESLSEESYNDSTLIMQLIRDNITLWTSEADGEDDENKDRPGERA